MRYELQDILSNQRTCDPAEAVLSTNYIYLIPDITVFLFLLSGCLKQISVLKSENNIRLKSCLCSEIGIWGCAVLYGDGSSAYCVLEFLIVMP